MNRAERRGGRLPYGLVRGLSRRDTVRAPPTAVARWQPDVAPLQNASLAARRLRGHVTAARDLANQRLPPDAAPLLWEVFVSPLVDKCRVLLELPPLCGPAGPARTMAASALAHAADAGVPGAEGTAPLQPPSPSHRVFSRYGSILP